eukprot:SAG31_NODE_4587_length_3110_cov_3.378944_2_plen_282_part_00
MSSIPIVCHENSWCPGFKTGTPKVLEIIGELVSRIQNRDTRKLCHLAAWTDQQTCGPRCGKQDGGWRLPGCPELAGQPGPLEAATDGSQWAFYSSFLTCSPEVKVAILSEFYAPIDGEKALALRALAEQCVDAAGRPVLDPDEFVKVAMVFEHNGADVSPATGDGERPREEVPQATAIFRIACKMSHSCAPCVLHFKRLNAEHHDFECCVHHSVRCCTRSNATWLTESADVAEAGRSRRLVRTLQPVIKGEELTVDYLVRPERAELCFRRDCCEMCRLGRT